MQEPRLRPCIAELLRTCVLPASPVLQIEHLARISSPIAPNVDTKSSVQRNISRVYLTDGSLTIQALVHRYHSVILQPGDRLELSEFEVRRSSKLNGTGQVIFLAVTSYSRLGSVDLTDGPDEGAFIRDTSSVSLKAGAKRPHADVTQQSSSSSRPSFVTSKQLQSEKLPPGSQVTGISSDESSESDKDEFQTVTPHFSEVDRRRETLRQIHLGSVGVQQNGAHSRPPSSENEDEFRSGGASHPALNNQTRRPELLTTPLVPLSDLPIHTLASLVHPPEKLPKSYQCTVFGIITWVSRSIITKPPFPPKRHVKIHDQSISDQRSGITLAIFIDAQTFKPDPGTVALFRGVTMQRCGDEVILNAYKTLMDRTGDSEWLIEDDKWLAEQGFNPKPLRSWWTRRQESHPSSR
ncbi:hypothetical protein DV736_g6032, partial [Chaetothyriales sp. CBS 134916]